MEDKIIIPEEIPTIPKDSKLAFQEEYKALVKKYGLTIQAYPIGVILDGGVFEFRSFEYRIVDIKSKIISQ